MTRIRNASWFALLVAAACSDTHTTQDTSAIPATNPNATAGGVIPNGVSTPGGATGSGAAATTGGGPLAGGSVSIGEASREAYCQGKGAPVTLTLGSPGPVSVTGTTNCRSGLASRLFQYGLCSCNDAVFTGAFAIDTLDSSVSAQDPTSRAASVGVNGDIVATGALDIRGSLIASGGGLMPITSGAYRIDGNYEANGDLITTGANITFGRDLWIDGDIAAVGLASVKGDIHQTPGHTTSGMSVGGQVVSQDFRIPDPCACASNQLLDIEAIVAAGRANNHNRDLGFSERTLFQLGIGAPLALDCGRFAFDGGYLTGDVQIHAAGRTALFIDGDLAITGRFGIDLGTSGELDVFVTGNLLLTGAGDVGSRDRPSALRFYVGGDGDIAITGANRFAANLYAPRSNVVVTGADDIYGSFFVGSYYATGAQRMHYDAAVLANDAGSMCEDECTRDLDCSNAQVCRGGRCTGLVTVF